MVCSQSFGNSKVTTYMIDFVKNNSNDKLHVSSKRKESLSQDIKYEVYLVMKVIIIIAVAVLFTKKELYVVIKF